MTTPYEVHSNQPLWRVKTILSVIQWASRPTALKITSSTGSKSLRPLPLSNVTVTIITTPGKLREVDLRSEPRSVRFQTQTPPQVNVQPHSYHGQEGNWLVGLGLRLRITDCGCVCVCVCLPMCLANAHLGWTC